MNFHDIIVKGAREHNLRNIDVVIPRNKLVVITGLSGSGKSSLAFDTIYAEGQRRYVESLSVYARQFLQQMEKPDCDSIEGLSPAVAIEARSSGHNPRSTVGTVTEIYDYLRLLYARCGQPVCPTCNIDISSRAPEQILEILLEKPEGQKLILLSPIARGKSGSFKKELEALRRNGYVRARIDGEDLELDSVTELKPRKKHDIDVVVDRLSIKDGVRGRLNDSLETALELSGGLVRADFGEGDQQLFSTIFACPDCGYSFDEISPRIFSFNSPYGACTACDGLGTIMRFDPDLIIPNPELSLREGAIKPWEKMSSVYYHQIIDALASHYKFDIYTPFKDLSKKIRDVLVYGSGDEKIEFYYEADDKRHFYHRPFDGVLSNLKRRYAEAVGGVPKKKGRGSYEATIAQLSVYQSRRPCPTCNGSRLKESSQAVKFGAKSIFDITSLSITEAIKFFAEVTPPSARAKVAEKLIREILTRLKFLADVGLDYLTLSRPAATLSGGESQRIRLAAQIGSGLMGVLYVLDEPSIGLHQRDNARLIETLIHLRDLGNTVLVVEHDEETMRAADYLIDMGPGAGKAGGLLISAGTPEEVAADENSLTGAYLSGAKSIDAPQRRRAAETFMVLEGAKRNNLKNIDLAIPLGALTCVTGVSGSGKSSLIIDTLLPALEQNLSREKVSAGSYSRLSGLDGIDKVIDIDQSPIGRTPRSNPATYTAAFNHIRDLFTALPEAKLRGYKPGRFSFNVAGGRCEACEGDGIIRIEMHFLPDIYVHCEVCGGKRYNRETLEVKYRGRNIADVLAMTVDDAYELFEVQPKIREKLDALREVGLGYITLGQSATTLSGGEAQRMKLARELSRGAALIQARQAELLSAEERFDTQARRGRARRFTRTIYILDEPTTGLHFADIAGLLDVLSRLVDAGHTVVVIEHNMDVIKSADWVIDLGPEGGERGGRIVAAGPPEEVAAKDTHTGRYLAQLLNRAGKGSR